MKIKTKSQLFLGVILLSFLLLLDVTFTRFLITSAEQTDRERMSRDLSRTAVTLKGEIRTLTAIAGNWAYSDKSWLYMTGEDPSYPKTYLNRGVLTNIGISSMIFIAPDHKVKLFRDFSAPDDVSTPESELQAIIDASGDDIFTNLPHDGTSGIIMKGGEPILFAMMHIRHSDMSGEPAGYLIATMALSPKMINQIGRNLHFTFSIDPLPAGREVHNPLLIKNSTKDSYITGRLLVRDHKGLPAFWISGIAPKIDITQADRKLQTLFLILAGVSLVLVFLFGFFMKRSVTKRLQVLQKEIETIRDETTEARRITADRSNDEIGSLQRTMSDFMAFFDFKQGEKNKADDITISVYRRFAEAGSRLCTKTLEDIATAFSPGDEKFRASLPRCAAVTRRFAESLGIPTEELIYVFSGALFNRMGQLSLPFSIRCKTTPLTSNELKDFRKYPIASRDIMNSVELLRPAAQIPYSWNENWDGTGFPQGLSGSSIPYEARIFAVVDAWNEMTRPWPGRRLPTEDEVCEKLRALAGTRLDPQLVEQFIAFIKEENKNNERA